MQLFRTNLASMSTSTKIKTNHNLTFNFKLSLAQLQPHFFRNICQQCMNYGVHVLEVRYLVIFRYCENINSWLLNQTKVMQRLLASDPELDQFYGLEFNLEVESQFRLHI